MKSDWLAFLGFGVLNLVAGGIGAFGPNMGFPFNFILLFVMWWAFFRMVAVFWGRIIPKWKEQLKPKN